MHVLTPPSGLPANLGEMLSDIKVDDESFSAMDAESFLHVIEAGRTLIENSAVADTRIKKFTLSDGPRLPSDVVEALPEKPVETPTRQDIVASFTGETMSPKPADVSPVPTPKQLPQQEVDAAVHVEVAVKEAFRESGPDLIQRDLRQRVGLGDVKTADTPEPIPENGIEKVADVDVPKMATQAVVGTVHDAKFGSQTAGLSDPGHRAALVSDPAVLPLRKGVAEGAAVIEETPTAVSQRDAQKPVIEGTPLVSIGAEKAVVTVQKDMSTSPKYRRDLDSKEPARVTNAEGAKQENTPLLADRSAKTVLADNALPHARLQDVPPEHTLTESVQGQDLKLVSGPLERQTTSPLSPNSWTDSQRLEVARLVSAQIVGQVKMTPGQPIEITLNPEELGKLKLTLATEAQNMVVSIAFERPETMEVMRRHIDQLARDFQSIGYDNVEFSFEQNSDQHSSNERAPLGDSSITLGDREQPLSPIESTNMPNGSSNLLSTSALDIRL